MPPELPKTSPRPAAAWWLLALAAALFTAAVVEYSLQYGRLIFVVQPWEDCRYVGDGLLRLTEFYGGGFGEALWSYFRNPPASPYSTYLASAGYAVFGPRDWAPYAASGVLILLLLVYLDRRLSDLAGWKRGLVLGFALLTPMAFLAVHEYRPDLACGLFTALGILAATGAPLDQLGRWGATAAGAWFGLALLAKPSIFPGTLIFLAGALALSALRAVSGGPSSGRLRECVRPAAWITGLALLVSLVYFAVGLRFQWQYLVSALFSPKRRFWILPGGLRTHLGFYLAGPGGDQVFYRFRPVFAAVLLCGAAGAWLHRERKFRLEAGIAGGALLLSYLVPTALPNKAMFGNATFAWLLVLYSCLILGGMLRGAVPRRIPRSAATCLAVMLVLAGTARFSWGKWGNRDGPYVRRTNQILRQIAGTLAEEARAGRSRVFFPTVGLLTEPGMWYLLLRQHADPQRISLTTRILEEDLEPYISDIRRADVVVATEEGASLQPVALPSERLQNQILSYLRASPGFRLLDQLPAASGKSYFVFERVPPGR
ncbi:MAG TPA: hypothetical protein VFA33_30110 [Bryobacteraceae bacterium]|nr:hypothetical protein [Bryobacteraceae bacterium]